MTALPSFSANISLLFSEHPLLERPAAARAAGFAAVETWWPFETASPSPAEIDRFVAAVEDADVILDAMNFFAGDLAAGERGIACVPGRHDEFRSSLAVVEEIASRLPCRKFNLLYGQLQDPAEHGAQREHAVEVYSEAAADLREVGGTVLIEPLTAGANGNYPLHSPADVDQLLDGPLKGSKNVKLLFDAFHLGNNGVDLLDAALRTDRIGHVQLADSPGRGEPGSGDLPLFDVVSVLRKAGYDGWIAGEYLPTRETIATLGWLDDWTDRINDARDGQHLQTSNTDQ